MHITKDEWQGLLDTLSDATERHIPEFHTREFYPGRGVWRNLDGPPRAHVITLIFRWLADRKHRIVYASVCKEEYARNFAAGNIPDELNTVWRFMGFHLMLAMQKYCMTFKNNKGHTIFIFDKEVREEMRVADIVRRPPQWSDTYYERGNKQDAMDQIVDVPYFADSRDVHLIQAADCQQKG